MLPTLYFSAKRGLIGVYHAARSQMLHFWLDCVIKAFWDSAFFTGTNKTGVMYAITVAIFSFSWSAWRQAEQHGGWKAAIMNWKEVFGTGAMIALAAWVLVFFCHLIAAPYGIYTEIEAQKRQTTQEADRQLRAAKDSMTAENRRLSDEIGLWQSKAAETKTDCAVKEGISQTLQKQNRDQQSTINGCLSQAMKLLTPDEFKLTMLKLPDLPISEAGNAAIKTANILLMTNKTITPVKLLVRCNAPVVSINGSVLGLPGMSTGNDQTLPSLSESTSCHRHGHQLLLWW